MFSSNHKPWNASSMSSYFTLQTYSFRIYSCWHKNSRNFTIQLTWCIKIITMYSIHSSDIQILSTNKFSTDTAHSMFLCTGVNWCQSSINIYSALLVVVHGFANTHRFNRRHSWIRAKYAFDLFGNYLAFDNLADHFMTQIVISLSPLPHFTLAWNAMKRKATLVVSVCDRMKNCLLYLYCLLFLSSYLYSSPSLDQLVFKFRLKCDIKAKLVIRNKKEINTQITINRAWNRNGIFLWYCFYFVCAHQRWINVT